MQSSLFSGRVAVVLGTIGSLLLASAVVIPAPFSIPAGLVGFILASLAGLGARPPNIVAGNAVLQGGAFAVATVVLTACVQLYPALTVQWQQSAMLFAVGLLCWLTGKALPNLTPAVQPAAIDAAAGTSVLTKAQAI
jgi:hypothetical protein